MEDKEFKEKYQKHKLILKEWRCEFEAHKGRIPANVSKILDLCLSPLQY